MNIIELDIMNELFQKSYKSQREIADATGYSLGKVNQTLAHLQEEGYLTQNHEISQKAMEEREAKKPQNAIILAAGFGMRMVPINREIPKGLLEVHGEALIERQISQLHEVGITDITIVVGFMKESYEYLIDQFEVKLVVNRDYAQKNNLHSLALTAGRLGNTYIVPCDIWCEKNPFSKDELYSWYMVTDLIDDESDVRVNRKLELASVDPGKGGNTMIGISYILLEDALWLAPRLLEMDRKKTYAGAFWESALMEKGKMRIWAKVKPSAWVCEINTYEQLREMDRHSKNLESDVLKLIAQTLGCKVSDITNIEMLKKGMTNRSFFLEHGDKRYIMRIPGEGTQQLIDRRQEYEVYQTIKDLNLSDAICYFNPDNGYKLTEYLPEGRSCDSENLEDVRKCMKVLRDFHHKGLKVNHTFDLFERIEFYESLWNGEPSCYRDYNETKKKVYEMKKYVDSQPKNWSLCHIDSVPDNFLIQGAGEDMQIHLIDWEYAGMQDTDVDIAMFAIYSMYEKNQVDELIDAYYPEGCAQEKRLKIYAYIGICGFLWSNWCEFKRHQGVEFGEYSLRQYRYAKEYYRYLSFPTSASNETLS
ncbi:MAG: winged helix-turn-helix transcriptional regulator [Clostridia bacterium]|nr:winged helix-turn-helix transcriptional regulator [Clostridia bacterium]NCC43447.1 winged helix-turn-helix transcriptional regulator [Clostridia bacterium]